MPDTAKNQCDYLQNVSQKCGLGFPIAHVGALLSLSCGTVLDLRICKHAGKDLNRDLRKLGQQFHDLRLDYL